MLHYQVVRTSPGVATLSNKMNNTVHYGHVRHTLALMCAKNHLLTFSSFLDIWENVEWPRFLDHPVHTNTLTNVISFKNLLPRKFCKNKVIITSSIPHKAKVNNKHYHETQTTYRRML